MNQEYFDHQERTNEEAVNGFELTVFQSNRNVLNKTITFSGGKLKKKANGQFSDGRVNVVECLGLGDFKRIIEMGRDNVAFSLGRPTVGGEFVKSADIVTSAQLGGEFHAGRISRSKEFFQFKKNKLGLFMFDVDGSGKSAGEVWKDLCEVDPQLVFVEHLIVHSSSSHIYEESTGTLLSPSSGYHIYCLVKNAADIPRYGEMFAKRNWLCGQGRIEISKAGSFLVRQLIDACIYSPERLIFEAPAELGMNLVQRRPGIDHKNGGVLDTECFPNLSNQEEGGYLRLVSKAKEAKKPESDKLRQGWLDEKCIEIVRQTGCDQAIALQAAKKFLEFDVLSDDFTLCFDSQGLVSVKELLANPELYDQQTLADPAEPEYNGGRNIAKFYWNDGRPRIHSHAHGGRDFRVVTTQSDEQAFSDAIEAAKTDAGAHWVPDVMRSARSLYQEDRAAYQRLRAELRANCEDAYVREWEKEVLKAEVEVVFDATRELVNVVNVVSNSFHDNKGKGYITIGLQTHKETWPLDSTAFYEWLEYFAYQEHGKAPSENTLKAVITTLQGQAKHEGEQHDVFLRCAPYGDGYLLDLTNDLWQVINVQPTGWEVLNESPVKFIRSNTSIPFPVPTQGDINDLWQHLNIPEGDRTLVLAFMLDSLRPDTDFPVLELSGEHGTAKSLTHTRIRQLTDPNSVPLRSAPKDVQDIYVSAGSNWQASFENMSYLSDKMQDGLCTLATGGGFATRRLYTNTEESVIEVKRPCIINGISAVATRPDLIDRIIHLELPRLRSYVSKRDLDRLFMGSWPGIFAGLLDLFSGTLRQLPNVTIHELPRMGDFALLGQAIHVALGDKRAFLDVYMENKSSSLHASLDASPVSLAVWEFAKDYPDGWTGTTKQLKQKLDQRLHDHEGWPKTPKGLGAALRRMGPALREVGVKITSQRKRDGYHLAIVYSDPSNALGDSVQNRHGSNLFDRIRDQC